VPTKLEPLTIRRVRAIDLDRVIALDAKVTGLAKPGYWQEIFKRFGKGQPVDRIFLVAGSARPTGRARLLGFIVGELRAWEFGSAPCGWIFALSVDSHARLHGVGEALFEAISVEFRNIGVSKLRTMVARDSLLNLMFFRAEGMMAGPYVQLEKDLD
jgi:GNAT superfamily N-acetyltransferase